MFYPELVSGLRKGELVDLLWNALDIQTRTIPVSKQYIKNPSGKLTLSRPKTEMSVRQISIPQEAVNLLIQGHGKHPETPYMFLSPNTGEINYPDSVVKLHEKTFKDARLEYICFQDLRHPDVKSKTKYFDILLNSVELCGILLMLSKYYRKRLYIFDNNASNFSWF